MFHIACFHVTLKLSNTQMKQGFTRDLRHAFINVNAHLYVVLSQDDTEREGKGNERREV